MLTGRVQHELELLKRHVIVLKKVMESGPIGIMKLSLETGIPDHLVRYSLHVLEQQGLIEPSTQGAVATKSAKEAFVEFRNELTQIRVMTEQIKRITIIGRTLCKKQ
jgi:predicted transcriptional regulator